MSAFPSIATAAPGLLPLAAPKPTEDEILAQTDADETGEFPPLLPGLTPELEKECIALVEEFERESYATWRYIFRDVLEAESFWKDIQHGFYDYETDVFRTPSLKEMTSAGESGSRFQFVTNIYRALGWTIISLLGQKIPSTVFLPVDYMKENDVSAARAAGDVAPIIERNNRVNLLHMKAVYHLFTGGICAAHVRYLADGDRFGWQEQPQITMAGVAQCPECGEYAPINNSAAPLNCPQCGTQVAPGEFQTIQIPTVSSTRRVPKGQELISIHGALELRLPPWVEDQPDQPYLGLVNEVHKSQVRASYGKRAKDIEGGFGASGPYDSWDRYARLALVESTVGYYSISNTNLITLKRYWLQRSAFHNIKDDAKREQLLKIFTKGAYVVIAEQKQLLDARDEAMKDHWRVCRGMEGHGMFKPPLGHSAISIQKRLNVLTNFIMEWVEFSAAGQGTFINAGLINPNAFRSQRRAPGMLYFLRLPAGGNLSAAIHTDQPPQLPQAIFKHSDDLLGFGQMFTGAVPTVSGGTEKSLKPTTYLADRQQALGKMFVPWQHLRQFWSEIMLLGVKEFAANRLDDEKYSLPGMNSNEPVNRLVRLDDLQGEFDAYPETNEAFPRLWDQQQAMFLEMLNSPDPVIQQVLGNSRNLPFAKTMLGLPTLYVPGEDDHAKQQLEIAQLLVSKPFRQINPMTGQAMVLPSIAPDDFADDHLEHINTIKQWAVAPSQGVRIKAENPDGYDNVIAHGKMHFEMMVQQAQQQAMLTAASGAVGAPGAVAAVGGGGGGGGGGGESITPAGGGENPTLQKGERQAATLEGKVAAQAQ